MRQDLVAKPSGGDRAGEDAAERGLGGDGGRFGPRGLGVFLHGGGLGNHHGRASAPRAAVVRSRGGSSNSRCVKDSTAAGYPRASSGSSNGLFPGLRMPRLLMRVTAGRPRRRPPAGG